VFHYFSLNQINKCLLQINNFFPINGATNPAQAIDEKGCTATAFQQARAVFEHLLAQGVSA